MKVKVLKPVEVKRVEEETYIRRHAQSLRTLLEQKPIIEAREILQREFNKILLHPSQ